MLSVEDQVKSAWLLDSASRYEAAVWRQQRLKVNDTCITSLQKLLDERQRQVDTSLNQIDGLLAVKRSLSTKCKNLVLKAKVTEQDIENAMHVVMHQSEDKLTRARARWETNLKCRQVEYLKSKTQAIRNLTVKGVEPEIKRLLELQRGDIMDLRTTRAHARREMGFKQDAKLSTRRLDLAGVVSRKYQDSEHQECVSIDQRIIRVEKQARSARVMKNLSKLRIQFQTQSREKSLLCCHQYGQAQTRQHKQLDIEYKQLANSRMLMQRTLDRGQESVTRARIADQASCALLASATYQKDLKGSFLAGAAELASCRDSAIDSLICQDQKLNLAFEDREILLNDSFFSKLEEKHLLVAAEIHARQSSWVDRKLTAASELHKKRERLSELRRGHVAIQLNHHAVLCRNAKLPEGTSEKRCAHFTLFGHLNCEYEAAETACCAIAIRLNNAAAACDRTLCRCTKAHQQVLAARDSEVMFSVHAKTEEEARLMQMVDLARVRYSHLIKVLACYKESAQ